MRLTALDPELDGTLADGALWLDCPFPACQATGPHRVLVPVSSAPFHERDPRQGDHPGAIRRNGKVKVWQASGMFPDSVTIQPSVNIVSEETGQTLCWHG